MMLVTRFGRCLARNARSCLQASVRHYDPEPGGEEIRSTTVHMLSQEDEDFLYVETYSQVGFKLSNGFRVIGPCVLFPRSILHWGVVGAHDLHSESLSLFPLLEPKLDILVLGIGDRDAKYDKNIIKYLRSHKINVEILPTDQACSTFNFLNSERRLVAAGLIPPSYMELEYDEDLVVRAQIEAQENIFELKTGYEYTKKPGEFAPLLAEYRKRMQAMGMGSVKEVEKTEGEKRQSKDKDSGTDDKKGSV